MVAAFSWNLHFAVELAAEAFATRFDGVHHSSPQPTLPDSSHRSAT
jgi:hypothetical protein